MNVGVIIVLVLLAITTLVLTVGIAVMARGGAINEKYGNKLMSLRVTFQALTLVAFALVMMAR
jgi:hypothetical protein